MVVLLSVLYNEALFPVGNEMACDSGGIFFSLMGAIFGSLGSRFPFTHSTSILSAHIISQPVCCWPVPLSTEKPVPHSAPYHTTALPNWAWWSSMNISVNCFYYLFFLEREEGREKERERNSNVWLLLKLPGLQTKPTTQACALTGNQTGDPLVHRGALNPLSHTG